MQTHVWNHASLIFAPLSECYGGLNSYEAELDNARSVLKSKQSAVIADKDVASAVVRESFTTESIIQPLVELYKAQCCSTAKQRCTIKDLYSDLATAIRVAA